MANYLDRAFQAYLETALWSSNDTIDDEDVSLDGYDIGDIDDDTKTALLDEFKRFFDEAIALPVDPTDEDSDRLNEWIYEFNGPEFDGYERLGHDFWLTRNGHGAGFWDRHWKTNIQGFDVDMGDRLTTLASSYGTCDLYIGDDGKIHQYTSNGRSPY